MPGTYSNCLDGEWLTNDHSKLGFADRRAVDMARVGG